MHRPGRTVEPGDAGVSFAEFQLVLLGTSGALVLVPQFACWRACRGLGYGGLWSLLLAVPVVNVVVIWWLAGARWPAVGCGKATSGRLEREQR